MEACHGQGIDGFCAAGYPEFMSSMTKKIGNAAFAASLFVLGAGAALGAAPAAGLTTLPGHVPPQVRGAARLGRVAPDENVELSLFVGIDQVLLDRTLAELYGPNASSNRRFLTPDEFALKFDLAAKRQALKDFAAASGLALNAAEDRPGSLIVRVSGPASRVEKAFGVQLNHYRAADGQVFRGHETDPIVPTSLAPHLHAVFGLSNYRGAKKPHLRPFRPGAAGALAGLSSSSGARPSALSGTGPNCYAGQCGLAPADVKTIYGLSGTLNGSGQTVAILELDGYAVADIGLYEAQFGLGSPTVTCTTADASCGVCGPNQTDPCNATTFSGGQPDQTTSGPDNGMIEVALDIEMVIGLSPGSRILVYTALNTNADLLNAYNNIATDDLAKVVSTSWGGDEASTYASDSTLMSSESLIFQKMATQGQTIFAAAGDKGAYDAGGDTTLVTDDPASQPYVTGVGGTSLSGSLSSHSESVWNNGCYDSSNNPVLCSAAGAAYSAGGGGVANYSGTYWPLPSYQSGVAGTYSPTYRNVPDVALNADPISSPYNICVAGTCNDAVKYTTLVGGTSAAAPLWAAVTALIDEQRQSNGYTPLGFGNAAFYHLGTGGSYGSDFNDITGGSNGYYSAAAGYDNASGWGSFKGDALIGALSAPFPPAAPVSNLNAVTQGVSSIQYSWNTLAGATGYDVYYATGGPTPLLTLRTASPSYTQTGLIGNETSGIFVYGENQGVEGPGAFVTTATYAAAPGALPSWAGWASSATFTYSACPAFPAASSCSGYVVQASTASDYSGTGFSSATANTGLLSLSLTGLGANTGYFFRFGYLNPNGTPSFGASSSFTTGSSLVAPASPFFDQISTGSIRFGWSSGGNPAGTTYLAQASTAADYSGTLLSKSGAALIEGFGGLSGDASYYFRVQGLGGPFLTAGPQATLAVAPAVSTNAFPSVGATSFTLAWSSGSDQSDTLYQADVSPSPSFASGVLTTQVRSPVAVFSSLTADTLYYARVSAIGRLGGVTAEVPLGSTTTLVQAPTLPGAPFSGLTTNGFTFSYNSAGNPAGTRYLVRVSTDPGFSVIGASSNTASASASFAGLLSNQLYNVEVAGLNASGAPTAFASASTATAVAAPTALAVPVTTATATGLGFSWSAAGLAPGTSYVAQVSSSPAFAFGVTSSATANAFAAFAGLQPNTTYWGQVQAVSLSANPSGPFLSPAAAGATLPNAPGAVASPFVLVDYTSATVAWTPLPLAPSSAAAEGYLVQFSSSANFATISASSAVAPGASSATLTGLSFATTYYARVGSVGWEGLANYLSLGMTGTALPPLSSGTVAASGIALAVPQAFSQLFSMRVLVPPGAFPAGTAISAVANVAPLPPAVTNEASSISPLGPSVGLVLAAAGLQPAVPVTIAMAYDVTQIPPGQNESRLALWRYDPNAGQWTLVPSQVDAVGHVLTAQTPHFSTFAPFFAAAGSDVSSVQVWPQPWEIGDSSSQYWASALSFSNLPAGATVKIFTIMGELVWSGTAAADGTLVWNGNNRFGRKAASGTYYAAFQSGGRTKTRRLVIIR